MIFTNPILVQKLKLEILPYELYDVFSDCFANDQDSYGNDVKQHTGIASAAACQELCNSNVDCKYFTYGSTIAAGNCWLKSKKATTLTAKTGLISGPKTCVGELVDTIIIAIKLRLLVSYFR